ncbi:MAG: hypothetical protein WC943_05010 [Elusimicrobiota bacterium]|jgi:hypothetical protein
MSAAWGPAGRKARDAAARLLDELKEAGLAAGPGEPDEGERAKERSGPPARRPSGLRGTVVMAVDTDEDVLRAQRLARDLCASVGLSHAESFRASMGVTELASCLVQWAGGRGSLVLAGSLRAGSGEFEVQGEVFPAAGGAPESAFRWPDLAGYLDSCRTHRDQDGRDLILARTAVKHLSADAAAAKTSAAAERR